MAFGIFGLFILFLFLDDFYGTLGGIGEDILEFILGNDHFACLRVISAERDCVKFALRCTNSAADTAVLINYRCTAAETS